jgi:hypothetical protein
MTDAVRTVVIASRDFALRASVVERELLAVLPEPVRDHFVVINRRRYPPKQVVSVITGLDRAEFTSHHARRILTGLGFPAGRSTGVGAGAVGVEPRPSQPDKSLGPPHGRATSRTSSETLESFVGLWVATRGPEILVAAATPREVVAWLAEHRQNAESMFRVPADEFEASGVAPR